MTEAQIGVRILWTTGAIMAAFGAVVLSVVLIARARARSARDLVVKYAAWFLIVPVVVVPLVCSRLGFQAVVCLLSLACFREYSRACGLWTDRGLVTLSYGLIACSYLPIFAGSYGLFQLTPLCVLGVLLVVPLRRNSYEHMIQKVCLTLLGVLCFGYLLSHLAYLRGSRHGLAAAFLLMTLVVCNDACAYLWGKLLGRHRLITAISPNKTAEGAVGGMLSVIAVAWLLRGMWPTDDPLPLVSAAVVVSVLGTFGDLVVSFIKRDLGIKDMGSAIPGHGGVLDRVDSLILSAPVFFHVARVCYG